jgi:hypothetical protein
MKQQMLKERVELLEIAEWMGYPRMGFGQSNGHKWSVRAGQPNWEKFCAVGHTTRLTTVLRNARILRDNGVVPYNPRRVESSGSSEGQEHRLVKPEGAGPQTQASPELSSAPDLLADFAEPSSVTRGESVTPVRSAAALRQQRFRDRKRSKA